MSITPLPAPPAGECPHCRSRTHTLPAASACAAGHAGRAAVYRWASQQSDPPTTEETKQLLGALIARVGMAGAARAFEAVIQLGWRPMEAEEVRPAITSRKPRCYIAGPIAGRPGAREMFADAAKLWEDSGYEVVNPFDVAPHEHEGDCPPGYTPGEGEHEHTSSACYMRADLRALLDCDAIYMLPGWRESRGATAEHTVAVACGIPVLEEGTTP